MRYILYILLLSLLVPSQTIGTTSASFFGIGLGSRAMGMGGAFTSMTNDASSIYWNPGSISNLDVNNAILDATNNRISPIFMSTLTSVFGMLPLVLFPGAGSELYKGVGSVILGGLSLSAILTLLIVPPMLKLFIHEKKV